MFAYINVTLFSWGDVERQEVFMSPLVFGITAATPVGAAPGDRTYMLYGGGFREDRYLRDRSPLTIMTNFPESL